MSTSELLNRLFAERWEHLALVTENRSFTYSELYRQAAGVSAWLADQGCNPGDVVALRLPNGWPFAIAYLACVLGRYNMVPVNLELSPNDQAYIIARVTPRQVLEDESELDTLPASEVNGPAFHSSTGKVTATFFTSGTTGRPKGVVHSVDTLVNNVMAFNQSLDLDLETKLYHVLPMAYMAGFLNTLLSPWIAGGTVFLGPRFRPANALRFWEQPVAWGVNTIWLTPTIAAILIRINRTPDIAAVLKRNMRHIFCGTAPLPATTRCAFRETFGCNLQESYGMSEILLVAAQTKEQAENFAGVGNPLPGIGITYRDAPDHNGERELVIRTPYTLVSYLLEEDESTPLLMDGTMPTGDTGAVDSNGLRITGRLKDLIIRGGLNISPTALEEILLRQPGIQEAAVVGLPHDFWGEIIVACLVTEAGYKADDLLLAVTQRCHTELGEGMRPDRYIRLESLPRNSSGKVQKNILREYIR